MKSVTIDLENQRVLVTGAAGFIGANLVTRLLSSVPGIRVVGLDNLNDYYDVSLKEHRLAAIAQMAPAGSWEFVRGDIADRDTVEELFDRYRFTVVVNLAAQAGVRYSIENPDTYIRSNLIGFFNILEACRRYPVQHLVYASSSSVYGNDARIPYSTDDKTDSPVSLYAATKKSNELMAHAYSKLYSIPATGLRFFTVYGPAGRPDMAYFSFTEKLRRGQPIQIFNHGCCERDFTYIDDIVEGISRVLVSPPERRVGPDGLPLPACAVYNIGNSRPENLMTFVEILHRELIGAGILQKDHDLRSVLQLLPMQAGDVAVTFADVSPLERDFGFRPQTTLEEGLRRFARWYREFYPEVAE